ncbi:outer membrane lipid asymmetry maintenance protein MlaD [Kiloniella sp. b19]|uniref:outer membrane lipid asymmetry maintenance protein MlaD n=1 Tax=Kiloniella sp. GXU_MW_B19 TaxID=3141326 RepID=UPI0031D633D6
MNRNLVETVVGALVLAVAIVFVVYAFNSSSSGSSGGYRLTAEFDDASGLVVGTDVRMAGVKIGRVVDQHLDGESFYAVVTMEIDRAVILPKGTSARILSESLLGGSFIGLTPGGEDDNLQDGDEIFDTQGAVNLMDLLGRFVFSSADSL